MALSETKTRERAIFVIAFIGVMVLGAGFVFSMLRNERTIQEQVPELNKEQNPAAIFIPLPQVYYRDTLMQRSKLHIPEPVSIKPIDLLSLPSEVQVLTLNGTKSGEAFTVVYPGNVNGYRWSVVMGLPIGQVFKTYSGMMPGWTHVMGSFTEEVSILEFEQAAFLARITLYAQTKDATGIHVEMVPKQ